MTKAKHKPKYHDLKTNSLISEELKKSSAAPPNQISELIPPQAAPAEIQTEHRVCFQVIRVTQRAFISLWGVLWKAPTHLWVTDKQTASLGGFMHGTMFVEQALSEKSHNSGAAGKKHFQFDLQWDELRSILLTFSGCDLKMNCVSFEWNRLELTSVWIWSSMTWSVFNHSCSLADRHKEQTVCLRKAFRSRACGRQVRRDRCVYLLKKYSLC